MSSMELEQSLNDADFNALRDIVHKETGITIADNRRSMLVTRLQRRLRETGEPTFRGYIKKVSDDPSEMQELTNRVTTNETYFYRTPRVWSYLREKSIPTFLEAQARRPMKVWSAAASTGEEGYTLGVVLEDVRQTTPGFDYSVLGTDISSRVLDIAKEGRYIGRSVARFKREDARLFETYMTGDDTEGYHVGPEVNRRVQFRLHNLLKPLSLGGPFDVVFLRNVLIYFTQEDQETILANIHQQMRPEGALIIGESETLKTLRCDFEPIEPLIYRPLLKGQGASN